MGVTHGDENVDGVRTLPTQVGHWPDCGGRGNASRQRAVEVPSRAIGYAAWLEEASVARMKCNEIRGTEPPSISLFAIVATKSTLLFLADAGWVSGNKTHRPELRTPLASWQGMA